MSEESKPLLQDKQTDKYLPKDYKSTDQDDKSPGKEGEDDIGSKSQVTCRVCQNIIDVIHKPEQHVVKCPACQEATPIRNPPPGKKYVRCLCNCLLVCNSSAPRIACPRQNCRRIVSLSPTPTGAQIPSIPGMTRVICVHCKDTFLFNTLKNMSARCPHCRKMSSVGSDFCRSRGHWYMSGFILLLIVSITVTATTYQYAGHNEAYIGLYVGLFGVSLVMLGRSIYFYTMKVSNIGGPPV